MSETLLFNIPQPAIGEKAAYSLNWYQSTDGKTWPSIPVDTILISSLVIDTDTGKYKWTSSLADPTKYHQLKTVSSDGIESPTGFILPPRPTIDLSQQSSNIIAEKIDTGDSSVPYLLGDDIELMLDIDSDILNLLGNSITVYVTDFYDNILSTIQATHIANGLFSAEYKIPTTLSKIYNLNNDQSPTGYPSTYYVLKDKWLMPDGSTLEYIFLVDRTGVQPAILDDCQYNITLSNVLGNDNSQGDPFTLRFSSHLNSFYTDTQEVRNVYLEILNTIDEFELLKDIILTSMHVDMHMRPDKIWYQDKYNLAVKQYVKYETARVLLSTLLNSNSESKELDMLKYSRSSADPEKLLNNLEVLVNKYSLIIWAGGKDTPFISRNFTKGINDPNRTQANRLGLDTSDPYPWVNTTTSNSVIEIDGNTVELRGTRTVSFLKNRSSFPNVYLRSEGTS